MQVIKRNGQTVPFDDTKIYNAIEQANEEIRSVYKESCLSDDVIDAIVDSVISSIGERTLSVEEIQDIVEEKLAIMSYPVSRAYIRYRYKKELARSNYNELMGAIEDKLMAKNVQNQNANVDERSFGGRMGETYGLVEKEFALNNLLSPMAKYNHLNNMIYIHDLDHYALGDHNCLSCPIDKLLAEGFKIKQTDIRPANSVNTAMQLVAVIFQLQSLQQFGGVSATHLDWSMVPYIRKSFAKHYKTGLQYLSSIEPSAIDDKVSSILNNIVDYSIDNEILKNYSTKVYQYALDMTEKETYQAVEGLYHNLNSLQSRSGNQLPFSSINYGTCTLIEGRMTTKALLDVSIEGIGALHRTPIFPCGIFQYMKGVNDKPNTPNYDLFRLALESTSKRLYPNYVNVDWSNNKGYDINDPCTYMSTMGLVS